MVISSYQAKQSELVNRIHRKDLMYRRPCSCCGNNGHSAMGMLEKLSFTQRKVRFTCPMVRKKHPIIWRPNLRDLILWPTPKRFVEYHKYREETVRRALIPFRMYGGGKWMSNIRFLNFKDEVIQLCKKTHRSFDPSEDYIFET